MNPILKKKLLVWMLLSINLVLAFLVGYIIPLMETESRGVFGLIIIPLLILLNYVFLDRFCYFLKHSRDSNENSED